MISRKNHDRRRQRRWPCRLQIHRPEQNFLLHIQKQTSGKIGLYMNANKTEYMCFRQKGAISILRAKPLK